MTFSKKFPLSLLASSLLLTTAVGAQQESELKPAMQQAQAINDSAAKTQEKIDKITDQMDSKLQQFKALNKQIADLEVYNLQMRKLIAGQEQQMSDLNEAMDKVSVIERQITPLMLRMIDGLEQFIALDIPFLPQERANRVKGLREMMDRADVAPSEKFRRVMEAYQIEMDFSRSMEAYTAVHQINGKDQNVEFLRVGRTALVYQTRDGQHQGIWNQNEGKWVELDDSYRSEINKGLRMAKKQIAPDLLTLPVAVTK